MQHIAYFVRLLPPPTELQEAKLTIGGIISVLVVYLFAFFFGVSLGPISWNVCSEVGASVLSTHIILTLVMVDISVTFKCKMLRNYYLYSMVVPGRSLTKICKRLLSVAIDCHCSYHPAAACFGGLGNIVSLTSPFKIY